MEMRFRGCEISILSGEIEILTFWAGGRNKIDRNQFHAKKSRANQPGFVVSGGSARANERY
jgi:hypothetical protein